MFMIVGATGSLGGSVAQALLERGERVRVLVRTESPMRATGRFTDPTALERAGAEVVGGDLREPESIAPHLSGVRALLSTASGTKRAPPDTVQAVDLEGTAALARMAREAGVEHMVYVSARGAAPQAPPFLRVKWQAEDAVRQHGPPATIIRPAAYMQDWIGFVYGAQLQGGTRVQAIGSTDPLKAYVDEADVAKGGLRRATGRPARCRCGRGTGGTLRRLGQGQRGRGAHGAGLGAAPHRGPPAGG